MVVDDNLHKFWKGKYGSTIELPRYAVNSHDRLLNVEVYFYRINIVALPNKSLFKLWKNEPKAETVFISKAATVADLANKVKRVLMGYMYFE